MRLTTTLDAIVREICILTLQNSSLSQYVRVALAVRRALMQVDLYFLPSVRSQLIEIGDNYTAQLPPDLLLITKVGILTSRGIITLMSDSSLRSADYEKSLKEVAYCECDEPPAEVVAVPVVEVLDCNVYHNCDWGGGIYGELYGQSALQSPILTYRHNIGFGVLEFSTGWISPGYKVLVEYKTEGAGNYSIVPVAAVPAIKAYAMYELSQGRPQVAMFHMNEFRRMSAQLKTLYANIDPMAIIHALAGAQRSSAK